MKVPKVIFDLTEALGKAKIDYRIGGGQAAVFYGLRDSAEDWDIAIDEVTPELKRVMEELGFTEIADSEGLSWEGPTLVDFIIADGEEYPTLDELGFHPVEGLKFVARSMMGYINWKEGESAYQHLKEYREKIEQTELPKPVQEVTDLERFLEASMCFTKEATSKYEQVIDVLPSWMKTSRKNQMSITQRLADTVKKLKTFAKTDQLPGGLADGMDNEDIAKLHGVPEDLIDKQVELGVEVEAEHTKNPAAQKEVAQDHEVEDPFYYDDSTGLGLDDLEKEAEEDKDKIQEKAKQQAAFLVNKILAIATRLEDENRPLQASLLDRLVQEAGLVTAYERTIDFTNMATKARKQRIANEVLTKATGVTKATMDYYRALEPVLKQFDQLLKQAEQLDKGSQKYIEIQRYVQDAFNSKYDPYNTDHAPTKIRYILELLKIEDIIQHNLEKVAAPELGEETIVEKFVQMLKDQGLLKEFNKLKKAIG